MDKDVLVAIVGSATAVAVAIGGWVFGWMMQRDAKKHERQRSRIARLSDEVRARIEVEKVACEWLAGLEGKSPQSVMLEARKRAEERSGLRPQMSPSDLLSRD